MRLITILAFALIAVPVMAVDDFDATFSVDGNSRNTAIVVTLTFGEPVGLTAVQAATITITIVYENFTATIFELTGDVTAVANKDIDASTAGTQIDGKTFMFTIPAAVNTATAKTIHLSIPKGVPSIDPADDKSSKAGILTIDLVGRIAPDRGRPRVVSIQRLGPVSQTVTSAFEEAKVTGAFDVRVVLTEALSGGLTLDKIQIDGGTASNLVAGVPFAWHGGRNSDGSPNPAQTVRPHPSEGGYYFDRNYGPLVGVALTSTDVNDTVPLPTGADGMYHQYRVTITPHRRVGTVKISIKAFHDRGSLFTNVYNPLDSTETEVAATSTEAKATVNIAANVTTADTDATATEAVIVEVPDTSVSIPMEGQIYISEIMFAGGGTLPQWIEISNGSRTEQVNLSGWTLTVANTTTDTDVSVGAKATFTIPEGM